MKGFPFLVALHWMGVVVGCLYFMGAIPDLHSLAREARQAHRALGDPASDSEIFVEIYGPWIGALLGATLVALLWTQVGINKRKLERFGVGLS